VEYGKALRGYETANGAYRVYGSNGPVGWTAEPLAPGPGVILGRKGAYRGVQDSSEPFFVIDTRSILSSAIRRAGSRGPSSRRMRIETSSSSFAISVFPPDRQKHTVTLPSGAFLDTLGGQGEIGIGYQRLALTAAARTAVPPGAPIEEYPVVVRALIVEAK
jgi:hypothetical protein